MKKYYVTPTFEVYNIQVANSLLSNSEQKNEEAIESSDILGNDEDMEDLIG